MVCNKKYRNFTFWVHIVFGFLKMAASVQSPETNCASRNDENDVEIQFIDEDELPFACISVLGRPESEEEIGWDDLAESSGDESEESESEEDEDAEKKNSGHGVKI